MPPENYRGPMIMPSSNDTPYLHEYLIQSWILSKSREHSSKEECSILLLEEGEASKHPRRVDVRLHVMCSLTGRSLGGPSCTVTEKYEIMSKTTARTFRHHM